MIHSRECLIYTIIIIYIIIIIIIPSPKPSPSDISHPFFFLLFL